MARHFLTHSLSLFRKGAIMSSQGHSASIGDSASTLLPTADVIPLPTANRHHATPSTFTKINVRRMQCSSGQEEKFFWDAGCRGFGIRALKSGRRSWVFQYRDEHGRTRRIVLGDVSAVSLEDAREAAHRTAASVAHGTNPSVERKRKRAAGTVIEVIDAYLLHAKSAKDPVHIKRLNAICAFTLRLFTMIVPKRYAGAILLHSWSVWRKAPVR